MHALVDHNAINLLEQMAAEVESLSTHLGRPLSLIAESDLNDPKLITPREAGGYGLQAPVGRRRAPRAAHAAHRRAAGLLRRLRLAGLPGDRADRRVLPRRHLVELPPAAARATRSTGTAIPGHRFVAYLQNHDQIGNRAVGDRLSATLSPGLLKVGATLLFTSPFTPDAVHGRGVGGQQPVAVLHQPPRARAGRWRCRTAGAASSPRTAGPRPTCPTRRTRRPSQRSKLDWSERSKPGHAEHPRAAQAADRAAPRATPDLTDPRLDKVEVWHGDQYVVIRRGRCVVAANLAAVPQTVSLRAVPSKVLLATEPGVVLQRDRVELPPETRRGGLRPLAA